MNRLARHTRQLAGLLATAVLCAACDSLPKAPKVDVLPTNPPDLSALSRANPPTPGSLFRTSVYRSPYENYRARHVGDIVTIQIAESLTASHVTSSTLDRETKFNNTVTSLPLLPNSLATKLNGAATSSDSLSGKGDSEAANTFSGTITTTVIDVLPNGHLIVSGEKQIGLNQMVDVMKFSGTVDPQLLQAGSTIPSTQVANVRIESRGRGAQDEAQTTGWFARFFLSLSPF